MLPSPPERFPTAYSAIRAREVGFIRWIATSGRDGSNGGEAALFLASRAESTIHLARSTIESLKFHRMVFDGAAGDGNIIQQGGSHRGIPVGLLGPYRGHTTLLRL